MPLPTLPEARDEDMSKYSIIDEKPVFVPGRHRPPLAVIENDDRDSSLPSTSLPFILMGIMIAKDNKQAVIQRSNNQGTVTLSIGQSLDGWTVADIKNNLIILTSGPIR